MSKINLTPKGLVDAICDFMHLEGNIGSKSRKQEYVFARVLVSYCLLYEGISLSMIGKVVLRDHSSISHYKRLIEDDYVFQKHLRRFKEFMNDEGVFIPSLETWIKNERGDN